VRAFSLTTKKHERVHFSCGVVNFAQLHFGEIYDTAPYIIYFPTETPSVDEQSAIAWLIYDNDTVVSYVQGHGGEKEEDFYLLFR
jgi:hypothetical protein